MDARNVDCNTISKTSVVYADDQSPAIKEDGKIHSSRCLSFGVLGVSGQSRESKIMLTIMLTKTLL